MKHIVIVALVMVIWLAMPARLDACPVCFQNVQSTLLDAARSGVLVMVGVTLFVLVAFGRFFLRLRALQSREEQAE